MKASLRGVGMMLRGVRIMVGCVMIMAFVCTPVTISHRSMAQEQSSGDASLLITDYLPGWDSARIESIFKNQDAEKRTAELARLIFRVSRQPVSRFESLVTSSDEPKIGDAISIQGSVQSVSRVSVPAALIDSLQFDQLFRVTIERDNKDDASTDSKKSSKTEIAELWSSKIPAKLLPGDRVQSAGVLIFSQDNQLTIAVPSLAWKPTQVLDPGLQSLAGTGFDISQIDLLRSRQRRILGVEDSDAFYGMLQSSLEDSAVSAQPIDPIELLTKADSFIGHHLSFRFEAVQSTRVMITDPQRQDQVASDHYWQIDGFADLGKHEVILKTTDPTDEPVTFGGRYPVSVVATSIPKSLEPNSLADQHQDVNLNGYFFRLWSYDTDLMRDSKAKQFGPLIVATGWTLLESPVADPKGVTRIGVAAAVTLIIGAAGIFFWNRKNHREDLEIKRRRRAEAPGDFRANEEN
jgi:hypothetical protein